MRKAFIFDMDGTLADNLRHHERAWQLFLTENGVDLPFETVVALAYGTEAEAVHRFLGPRSEAETRRLGQRKEDIYRAHYSPEMAERPGLRAFLEKTQAAGIAIGLGTAGGWANVEFLIGGLALRDFFEAIVAGEDVSKGKPDPEVFLKCAEKLAVLPSNCIVFEDSEKGLLAAQRAGMRAVAVGDDASDAFLASMGMAFVRRIADFEGLAPDELW